jgi:GxxExxY protein
MHENEITGAVIAAAIEVHKSLGPGLLESAYEECLCRELLLRNLKFERQVNIPVRYKGVQLECGYKLDLIVEDKAIVEIKSVEKVTSVHTKQLMTYLRLKDKKVGLLINFNEAVLKKGIHRVINGFLEPLERE